MPAIHPACVQLCEHIHIGSRRVDSQLLKVYVDHYGTPLMTTASAIDAPLYHRLPVHAPCADVSWRETSHPSEHEQM